MIQTSHHVMTTRQVTAKRNPTKKSTIVPVEARSSASPSLVATAEINTVTGVSLLIPAIEQCRGSAGRNAAIDP
jgi:hypothetical protein